MPNYYLLSITALTLFDAAFLASSWKSRTLLSISGLIGVSFLAVMAGEYHREITILPTGNVPAPSYLRAKVMLFEGILWGVLFQEVRFQYGKIRRKKR